MRAVGSVGSRQVRWWKTEKNQFLVVRPTETYRGLCIGIGSGGREKECITRTIASRVGSKTYHALDDLRRLPERRRLESRMCEAFHEFRGRDIPSGEVVKV